MQIPNQLFIDGLWVPSSDGSTFEVVNPATEEVVDNVSSATTSDVQAALASAERAFQSWRQVDGWTRARVLRQIAEYIRTHQDAMAETLTEEQGKPLPEAKAEINATADQFEWYSGEATRIYGRLIDGHSREQRYLVMRQPIGPVAAFSPWNFPAMLSARKIAPAIAAGCSVILKPPSEAPRSALQLANAFGHAELPAGVVNMLTGSASMISQSLVSSGVIRKVSLTGSVRVGKLLMELCARELIPITLELGGHSPVLVFEDADVYRAAELCARGKFRNNGQVCICASRFFVQESILEPFVQRFCEVTSSLKLGDGRQPGVDVGPLANRDRLLATESLLRDALEKGASLCCGGKRSDKMERGFFFEPTVLCGVDSSMDLMNDEPFCPIAPITTFTDLEDGIQKANQSKFGLAAYVFTNNTRTAFLASEELDVGMVGVNNLIISTAEAPFGGTKHSGFGREGGLEWMDAYTNTKYINIML